MAPGISRREPPDEPPFEINLHDMRPFQALRHLGQELHGCRLRRMSQVLVITGRGWGNLQQKPVLRPQVEAWLRGPEGQRLGIVGFEACHQGGALLVTLRTGASPMT